MGGERQLVQGSRGQKELGSAFNACVRYGKYYQPHCRESNQEVLLLFQTFVPHITPGEGEISKERDLRRLSLRVRGGARHDKR